MWAPPVAKRVFRVEVVITMAIERTRLPATEKLTRCEVEVLEKVKRTPRHPSVSYGEKVAGIGRGSGGL